MPKPRHHLAVGSVACALIVLQVSFTRLIGYKLFYHFVFLAIALTLLGLGAAGTYVAIAPRRRSLDAQVYAFLGLLVVMVPLSFLLLANPFVIEADQILAIKLTGTGAIEYLVWSSVFMVALNFVGGVVLTSIFTEFSAHMGALYAKDLLGAGIGCVLSVGIMKYFSPPAAFLAAALLVVPTQLAFYSSVGRDEPGRLKGLLQCFAGVCLVIIVLVGPAHLSNFQNWRTTGRSPAVAMVKYVWNHILRTDHANGMYILDGEASTPTIVWDTNTQNLPITEPAYVVSRQNPRVGIIGFGGGLQVAEARRAHATSIVGVDINPAIAHWVLNEDRGLNQGLFEAPNIRLVNGEGRHTLSAYHSELDLVVIHAIDTYAAAAGGAYALTENFLYTKEAFLDYFGALRDGGVVSLSRWLFNPPREDMRLFVTAMDALADYGVADPSAHVMMVAPLADYGLLKQYRARVMGYLLVSKTPFTAAQVQAAMAHAARNHWTLLYAPGLHIDSPFTSYVEAKDRQAFSRAYPYVISSVTDSKPYLFQFYDPLKPNAYVAEQDWAVSAIYQSSAILLPVALLLSIVLSLALILLPLLWARYRRREEDDARRVSITPSAVLFFACLGVGYMALEVPLTQVLALYLGHPIYGFSVALVALLLSSGAGSMAIDWLPITRSRVCLAIAAAVALMTVGIFPLVHGTMALPDPVRFTLALVVTALCGFPMGFPLALGVRRLGASNKLDVAWAWGVNAAASVIGSCSVMVVMVFLGSQYALGLSVACYLLAALACRGDDVADSRLARSEA